MNAKRNASDEKIGRVVATNLIILESVFMFMLIS